MNCKHNTCLNTASNRKDLSLNVLSHVTYRQFSDYMLGFIDTLFTQLGITLNYSAVADLHTLQFTVTHALGLKSYPGKGFITVSL
jgi:hypothetical protein